MKKLYYRILAVFLVILFQYLGACDMSSVDLAKNFRSAGGVTGAGRGGSMARFAIVDQVLYTVNYSNLVTYNIAEGANPLKVSDITIGANIETIFPYKNRLYIGAQNGMFIYDVTDPLKPVFMGNYEHITSCDPVVVQGNYAYVTLRGGSQCRSNQNILDVVNIENPTSPRTVRTLDMIHPHGLAVQGNRLFVCEGEHGLKVFDISDPTNPSLITFIRDIQTYDVISLRELLIVSGKDGIYQYNYSLGKMKLLSKIE